MTEASSCTMTMMQTITAICIENLECLHHKTEIPFEVFYVRSSETLILWKEYWMEDE